MDTKTKSARDDRIRHRAYAIWQKAGEPAGQDRAHWAKACEEIDEEDREGAVPGEPVSSAALPTADAFATPVEKEPAPASTPANGTMASSIQNRRKQSANGSRMGRSA